MWVEIFSNRVDRESWFNSTPRDKKSIWSGPLGDRKPPRPITLWPAIELMDLPRPEGRVPDRSPRRQAEENPQPALGRRHSSINGPLLTTWSYFWRSQTALRTRVCCVGRPSHENSGLLRGPAVTWTQARLNWCSHSVPRRLWTARPSDRTLQSKWVKSARVMKRKERLNDRYKFKDMKEAKGRPSARGRWVRERTWAGGGGAEGWESP